MNKIYEAPPLFKHTAGGLQIWRIWVETETEECGVICTEYGLLKGKQQTKRDPVTKGKNTGRRNATTPVQQAMAEAKSKWEKKRDRDCYAEDPTGRESYLKRQRAPMLAETYKDFAHKVQWDTAYGQPKFDGHRCMSRRGQLVSEMVSRNFQAIDTLPHIAAELKEALLPSEAFDGEIYLHGYTINEIGAAISATNELSPKLEYHIYDSPMLDDVFRDRLEFVRKRLKQGGFQFLKLVETVELKTEEQAWQFQKHCIGQGFEGAMLRYGNDTYAAGERSQTILKLKSWKDAEFQIVSVAEGRGTMAGMAIFKCVTDKDHPFDVLAGGTHVQKQKAWNDRDRWVGRLITVEFAAYTNTETPVPWHPRVKKGTLVELPDE